MVGLKKKEKNVFHLCDACSKITQTMSSTFATRLSSRCARCAVARASNKNSSFVLLPQAALVRSFSSKTVEHGTVKWFDVKKGFGYISTEDGSPDVFVHQTAIHGNGFRSLRDGESVEYVLMTDRDTGRVKAERVTGPNGSQVQGAAKEDSDSDFGTGFGSNGGGGGRGGPGSRNSDGFGDKKDFDSGFGTTGFGSDRGGGGGLGSRDSGGFGDKEDFDSGFGTGFGSGGGGGGRGGLGSRDSGGFGGIKKEKDDSGDERSYLMKLLEEDSDIDDLESDSDSDSDSDEEEGKK